MWPNTINSHLISNCGVGVGVGGRQAGVIPIKELTFNNSISRMTWTEEEYKR